MLKVGCTRTTDNKVYSLQRNSGFMRVRHFGFLANRCRRQCLVQIRDELAAPALVEK